MDDKELADAVVELGVGEESTSYYEVLDGFYSIDILDEDPWMKPDKFVCDWRVVGALMEKVLGRPNWLDMALNRKCRSEPDNVARCWISPQGELEGDETYHVRNESLPRAIVEVCCEALSE